MPGGGSWLLCVLSVLSMWDSLVRMLHISVSSVVYCGVVFRAMFVIVWRCEVEV